MKYLILFFILIGVTFSIAELVTNKLLIKHEGTIVYGDCSIDANGAVTILNGKTVAQAAATFWPAIREKNPSITVAMRNSTLQLQQIGLYFVGNGGEVRMSFVQKKVSYKGYNPDAASLLFWDEVTAIYQSQI